VPVSKIALLLVLTPALAFLSKPLPAQAVHAPVRAAATEPEEDPIALRGSQWTQRIESDLVDEKFDELDHMAAEYRTQKTRFKGGGWKLTAFYGALDKPELTDKDTRDHMEHLKHWIAQRPESITARVALATSLHRWAWVARGNGEVNTVTPEGWRQFNERIKESESVLKAAANLHERCPAWYSEMMIVGLAQGWDANRMKDLFEQAVQFEPDYFRFYKEYANYLLPKWEGKPGDASTFAKTAADNVGGEAGDQIYFHIALVLVSRSNGSFPVKEMDWARIQRGYQSLTARYGNTSGLKNHIAYMAWKFRDAAFARQQFEQIGDKWSRGVWRDKEHFDRARDWAQSHS
jgi:hypothetical protein